MLPLLQVRCGACHAPDGVEASRPFQTYEQIYPQRTNILTQLHACLMPPADQPQPTAAERGILFGWLVCGAMNN